MLSACCPQVKKGITNIMIICQLYSFVMGEWLVLNMFMLQAVDVCKLQYKLSTEWDQLI